MNKFDEKHIDDKYAKLKKIIKKTDKAAIAFSGGVDSTLLLKVAFDLLNRNAKAFTIRSDIFPVRESGEAEKTAAKIGADHIFIDLDEQNIEDFAKNTPDRCFLCKTEIFSRIKSEAKKREFDYLFDGSNIDDLSDFRPGKKAAIMLGIRSPLEDAGLTKKDIRILSKKLNLSTWNKPSSACLASRFPYYTEITKKALEQVKKAEDFLFKLGMRIIRVRHHGSIARIEAGTEEMQLIQKDFLNNKISEYLKSLGYKYVCLDMEGYRTGSMNKTLEKTVNRQP